MNDHLIYLWLDLRIWLDDRLHDGQPRTWKQIRGRR